MKKTFAPHVTALLSAAGAVLTIIHPGFKVPSVVEGLVASLCVLVSAVIEAIHTVGKNSLNNNLALATHLANQAAAAVKADVAPTAPVINAPTAAAAAAVAPQA
jgi:hypothetical protein